MLEDSPVINFTTGALIRHADHLFKYIKTKEEEEKVNFLLRFSPFPDELRNSSFSGRRALNLDEGIFLFVCLFVCLVLFGVVWCCFFVCVDVIVFLFVFYLFLNSLHKIKIIIKTQITKTK